MGERPREVNWFAVVVNAVMWAVALFVVWTQVAGWDTIASRVFAFFGAVWLLFCWSLAGLLRVPVKKTWMHFVGSVVVLGSVLFFNFPMRVSFAAIRGTMDGLADSIEQGQVFDAPFRVGPHAIEKGETHGQMACLWTTATLGDKEGFCRLRVGDPAEHINEWSIASLGGGWYHIVED